MIIGAEKFILHSKQHYDAQRLEYASSDYWYPSEQFMNTITLLHWIRKRMFSIVSNILLDLIHMSYKSIRLILYLETKQLPQANTMDRISRIILIQRLRIISFQCFFSRSLSELRYSFINTTLLMSTGFCLPQLIYPQRQELFQYTILFYYMNFSTLFCFSVMRVHNSIFRY